MNILPILYSPSRKTKEILLEKIYRPPVDRYCIEFPGGLIDENESKESAALRELKEETGYTGMLLEGVPTPLLPVCSGTGSESTCLVPVLVGDDGVNSNLDKSRFGGEFSGECKAASGRR